MLVIFLLKYTKKAMGALAVTGQNDGSLLLATKIFRKAFRRSFGGNTIYLTFA